MVEVLSAKNEALTDIPEIFYKNYCQLKKTA